MSADRRHRKSVAGVACPLAVAALSASLIAPAGRADVPAGCYLIGNGIAVDTRTTLAWQQNIDPGSYSWADAQAYCASLDLNGPGWRVPSVKELTTLVDFDRFDPAVDTATFPGTPSDFFWSSSADASSATAAWGVNFTRGSGGAAPIDFLNRVRCVR